MMAVFITLLAACFASLSNFLLRKNIEATSSSKGYLIGMYIFSLITALITSPSLLHEPFSMGMFFSGSLTGFLNVALMGITALALMKGPAGLSFAFQTSGSVFPAIFLFFVFGLEYGFTLSTGMLIGLALVLGGLFWGALWQKDPTKGLNKEWMIYALSIFVIQTFALTVIQWRCLAFQETPSHPLIPFQCTESQDVWFMPGMFLAALFLQIGLVLWSGYRLKKQDVIYGSLGGALNGLTTYLLLLGTAIATPIEKGIVFPAFAIGVIVICNIWGALIYSEKVNWWANLLCSAGIVVASLG